MKQLVKNYVCSAYKCVFNDGCGGCGIKADAVNIGANGFCGNYRHINKQALIGGLLKEIKDMLELEHGDKMQEDLGKYELYTDADYNCFMCSGGSPTLQDFACDEAIAAMVDAYNVLIKDKPMHCKLIE